MFKRLWRWISALFNRTMDQVEDPEMMLDQARREMTESHTRNRERAVQAITQKNNLQALVEKEKSEVSRLEKLAEQALKQGKRELALQLMREKMTHDQSLVSLEQSLVQAQASVDQVKIAIQREEDLIRKKTAEALAMKARWKQAQIQNSIQKNLSGMQFEDINSGFGVAEEKIRNMESQASARSEMYATSMDAKISELQAGTADVEADEELRKMEERLGMATSSPAIAPAATSTEITDVEKELQQLEQKLSPQSTDTPPPKP